MTALKLCGDSNAEEEGEKFKKKFVARAPNLDYAIPFRASMTTQSRQLLRVFAQYRDNPRTHYTAKSWSNSAKLDLDATASPTTMLKDRPLRAKQARHHLSRVSW